MAQQHRIHGDRKGRKEDEKDRKEDEATLMIDEARMVLPGIQALFGFQLIAVFNQKFAELERSEQVTHLISLLLVAFAVAIIMTPAAYHRQEEQGRISGRFIRLASRLMTFAMVPLMLGLCLDIYLVSDVLLEISVTSVVIGSVLFCIFHVLWFIYPQAKRRRPPA